MSPPTAVSVVCALGLWAVTAVFAAPSDSLVVDIVTNGSYSIKINNNTWLRNAPTFFRVDGQVFTAGKNLKLNMTTGSSGIDTLGTYQTTTFVYQAGGNEIHASIRTYELLPVIVFSQVYPNGANRTKASGVNDVISGFPSFSVNTEDSANSSLGYLAYGGMMCGDTEKSFGRFTTKTFIIADGVVGGPIALFDGSGATLVISPSSNFMAASNSHSRATNSLSYGIMGEVDTVPPGYSLDTILYFGDAGVNRAFQGWGELLRFLYRRTDEFVSNDLTINYLGYWTDNGAYYYYNTEPNKTYQDTMLDVRAYSLQSNVPYRYLQYDSWWYYKSIQDGVKTWESRPDVFPDGFEYVHQKTALPVSAHNRYWASDTTYARHNGGNYNFVVETFKAVPDDQTFWNDLFANATRWGLYTYEQDWLNVEFAGVEALLTDIDLGSRWLNQMGTAALDYRLTIQYCMANSRHVMQSLHNPAVTQVRVSNDYHPGSDQWKIGVSSIFAHAMGLAPFKDTFWTTTVQPGNPYGGTEPHNLLQLAVAVFSTGPVGPSDMVGGTDVPLLQRCCNAEGLILKPSKPATAIDDQIYTSAFGSSSGVNGDVWTTFTAISNIFFGIIFAPDITGSYSLTPEAAGFGQILTSKVFSANNVSDMADFRSDKPLVISGCNRSEPCIYYVAPVLKLSPPTLLLGELTKLVPVSPQRVTSITVGADVTVHVRGAARERVTFTFLQASEVVSVDCVIGATGSAIISLNSRSC
ncbi:hypothetical protein C0Q70_18373 [Pomacea canaliculata]|uniref:Uncharacterized protein n=1 Tax=Pomacea canaliculata TaxID=400727 RepID=A0A2T7NN00_POMCA|nr:uncharacterized protein LOC112576057 [Pomacea canaliculata]PVD22557.1 hypothetical protein C0Q70_18373 [Pomacea canaliculata]